MYPDRLADNLPKGEWSDGDCFSGGELEFVSAFVHPHYAIGMHTHQFYEINIVLRGRGRHYIESFSCDAREGCVFVIPPGIRHGYVQEEALDVLHILVTRGFFEHYAAEMRLLPGFSILFEIEPMLRGACGEDLFLRLDFAQAQRLRPALDALLDACTLPYEGREVIKNARALDVIGRLCAKVRASRPEEQTAPGCSARQFLHSMEAIRARCGQKLSLDELARDAHMSRSTYIRQFRRVCRCSPGRYLTRCRVERAKQMIAAPGISLTEVAQACGFYDSSHFIRMFTKEEGVSPLQYREKRGKDRNGEGLA